MLAYDPATHRPPTPTEQFLDPYLGKGYRVCMSGTDLFGTVRAVEFLGEPPKVLIDWDYYTPEEGTRSWISPDYLVLVAVPT